jgi:hypothetical protein
MPELIPVPAPLPAEPADLFTFALDRLTWQNVRDLLPVDETSRYWTVATAGNLSLLARAATDFNASLSDWTTREDSPGLFAAQDSANLWPRIPMGLLLGWHKRNHRTRILRTLPRRNLPTKPPSLRLHPSRPR